MAGVENTSTTPAESGPSADGLDDLLAYAHAHAATGDTRMWVADLERMLNVAWSLMTPEQRIRFREHPAIRALIEAAGGSSTPP
jgi:hypothetical protein